MAFDVYMKITATKLGELKGYSTNKAHQDWIEVLEFDHTLVSPRDESSGAASGRIQFKPIKIKKRVDPATPGIIQALASNDNLKEVVWEFWTAGATGGLQKYMDIKINNGRIVSSNMGMHPEESATKGSGIVTQTIELTYDVMSWKYQGFKVDGSAFGGPKETEIKWEHM
jgi:type VI secretion system secreted protein Hcp